MDTFCKRLYAFSCKFIELFALVLSALLFLGAFVCTGYATDMESQKVLLSLDNPLWGLFGIAAGIALMYLVTRLLDGERLAGGKRLSRALTVGNRPLRILFAAVALLYLVLGLFLVLFGKTVPAADAYSVYSAAQSAARGDLSVIHPTDSYLSYYPQQVGLMAFEELFIRLWNLLPTGQHAYHGLKLLYILLAIASLSFQRKTMHLIWADEKAEQIFLLLSALNLPFIMYTSFVYGEIPSFFTFSAGLYLLTKYLKDADKGTVKRTSSAVGAVICLVLSVMLRKNSLILILAVCIVLIGEWLRTRHHTLPLLAIVLLICSIGILPAVQKTYELRSGSTLKSGVTATSYLAMGMQESSRANGWYNGFNFETYRDTGMDTAATNTISRQAIADRLSYFKAHPAYAASFYLGKHLSQWADGTFACRQATLATFGGRSDVCTSLYEGEYSRFFIVYCNLFQNLLYLGVFCFCRFVWKNARRAKAPATEAVTLQQFEQTAETDTAPILVQYAGFIGVVGGFLFHIFWEANSRYIFLYGLLLVPYAARGLSGIFTIILRKGELS